MHLGKFLVRSFPTELLRLVPIRCRSLDRPFCQLLPSLVGTLGRMERQIVREVITFQFSDGGLRSFGPPGRS